MRCELEGKDAWERTLSIQSRNMPPRDYWDDVYLVAIEAPYGRGQAGTNAILNRVVGAIAASLPANLRKPERCWVVRPDEWKGGLELKGKPTELDIERLAGQRHPINAGYLSLEQIADYQNGRDAYCIALWARDTNAKAIAATLAPLDVEGDAA